MSIIRYYNTEYKLLLRGPGFYMMLVSMIATLYVLLQSTEARLDRAAYVLDISVVYCSIVIIMLPLLATAVARRDEEWKTAAMMASFPYRTWEMEAARILCTATLPFLAALVPMGVYAWLIVGDGISWGLREWYTCAVFASFAIPMLFATVLAYLVGILIRTRYSYLISFVLLISLANSPKILPISHALPPHKRVWLDYSLVSDIGNSYSRMWGFIYDPAFWLHRGMVATTTVGMALAILLVVCWRRRERIRKWMVYPLMLVLGATLIWVGSAMYEHLQERVDIADANEHFYSERLTSANTPSQQRELEQLLVAGIAEGKYTEEDIEEMSRITLNSKEIGLISNPLSVSHIKDLFVGMKFLDLHITSYKLELKLLPRHGLEIQATMQASNGQMETLERFPIMLRHIFDINELKVNGVIAAYEWEEATDVLWVIPAVDVMPGEPLDIEMTYSGTINDWRHYYSFFPSRDRWEQAAIVENNRLFLPAFYGWYPVIGNSRLSESDTHKFELEAFQERRRAADILDTHLPRPVADFEVSFTGPSGLKLFSNASLIANKQAGEKEVTITHLELHEANGLTLFGGDLQYAEVTADGKTLRLLTSGQLPYRSVEEAAQLTAKQYAEAMQTLKMLDGKTATSFPQTITMALADYPYKRLNEFSSTETSMVDPVAAGPEARDVHYLSKFGYFGAEIEQGKNGNIQLETARYWLDYSTKRRESSNARESYFNSQYILNHFFQAYIERKVSGEETTDPLFESGNYFWDKPNQIYELMNTIYSQYGIESVYEVIKLVYDSIGTEQLIEDSDEQMEELLVGYLKRKAEGEK